MAEKPIHFNQKREFREIVVDSFLFLKQENKGLIKLMVRYVVPFVVLYAFVAVYFQKNILFKIDFSDPETFMENIRPVYLNLFLFTFFGLFVQAMLIGTFYSYIEIYLKKGAGNFEFSEITEQLYKNSTLALKAAGFWFIAVFTGLILCFVPGVFLATSLSLVFSLIIFEKEKFNQAVLRSVFLVNTQWWNTFVLNVFGVAIVWMIGLLFSIPMNMADTSGIIATTLNNGNISRVPQTYWYLSGLSTAVSSLLWIIPYTFLAFQYFNLKERAGNMPGGGNGSMWRPLE